MAEDTKVMMSDFSHKKIKDVNEDDEIMGVYSFKPGDSSRTVQVLKPQKIIKKWESGSQDVQYSVKIDDDELVCSSEHEFLTVKKKPNKSYEWKKIKDYKKEDEFLLHVPKIEIKKDSKDYMLGYSVGVTQGDGSINGKQVSFGFTDETLAKYVHYLFTSVWGNDNKIYEYRKSTVGNQIYDLRYYNKKFIEYYKNVDVLKQNDDFLRGYCAGIFDAEGTNSKNHNCYISSIKKNEANLILKCFKKININVSLNSWKSDVVSTGIVYSINLLGTTLERNLNLLKLNIKCKYKLRLNMLTPIKKDAKVTALKKRKKLYDIETELHNFIAEGMVVHNCAWKDKAGVTLCDTPYTSWNPEKAYELDVKGLIKKLNKLNRKHVVITGGEPLLQPDIAEVVNCLLYNENVVTVETNGTIYNPNMKGAFMSISPKLKSSYAQEEGTTEYDIHRRNNDYTLTLKEWVKTNDYQVKFVINDEQDLDEMIGAQIATRFRHDKTYLMPQGITREQLQEKSQWLFQKCLDYNVNFSPRMHIDVFGNKRGI